MKIFAIADLHLSISTPEKTMEDFGSCWKNYMNRIKENWEKLITNNDLVLISGDISWAIKLEKAVEDLKWIDNLPGKKIIIRGNHDYWWPTKSKLKAVLPPSIQIIQNDSIAINDISIGGSRLWDAPDISFNSYINFAENPHAKKDIEEDIQKDLSLKIYERELLRLEQSLSTLDKNAKLKIAMTHYPPLSADLKDSRATKLLEKYNVDISIFGHLHNVKKEKKLFGEKNSIKYILTSADYIDFNPIEIY